MDGWRLAANAIRLVSAQGRSDGRPANSYFVELYSTLADALESGGGEDLAKLKEEKEELRKAGEPNGVSLLRRHAGETAARRIVRCPKSAVFAL